MSTLDQHPALQTIKLLHVGQSGSGKTGALASLVEAGYKLYILDYDKGLDIIVNVLKAKGLSRLLKNVEYETINEEMKFKGGKAIVAAATAFRRAGQVLTDWKVDQLGPESVVVLDTLNTFSQVGFNEAMKMSARLNVAGDGGRPRQQEYGIMADMVLAFIDTLTNVTTVRPNPEPGKDNIVIPGVDCHVIVNTHVKFLAAEDEALLASRDKNIEFTRALGLPEAKGQEVPRNIAKYFNTVIYSSVVGRGVGAKRTIFTTPQGVVDVRTSSPYTVKPTYSVETGLADMFRDILGHGAPQVPGTLESPKPALQVQA